MFFPHSVRDWSPYGAELVPPSRVSLKLGAELASRGSLWEGLSLPAHGLGVSVVPTSDAVSGAVTWS